MKYNNLYTKKGDDGMTSLWTGGRVSKTDPRIRCVGVLDELNANLGLSYSMFLNKASPVKATNLHFKLRTHTHDALTKLMGEVVSDNQCFAKKYYKYLLSIHDQICKDSQDKELNGWSVYGTTGVTCAMYSVASTVCRRAEIELLTLKESGKVISEDCYKYMNLLSKVLYILSLG